MSRNRESKNPETCESDLSYQLDCLDHTAVLSLYCDITGAKIDLLSWYHHK